MLNSTAQALEDLRTAQGLDAILFTDLKNLRFLCGFTGTDAALLFLKGRTVFLTDSRYTQQAREQVQADEIIQYPTKVEGIAEALSRHGVKVLGFEAENLSCASLERLRSAAKEELQWKALAKELQGLRRHKSAAELAALEEATAIAARGFDKILPLLRPGVPESDIARELEFALRLEGGQEKSFDFIVASGIRGALPHGVASGKRIEAGELVTIDFGTVVRGYHSDETVTLAVGEVPDELRLVYDIVLEAHDLAAAALRPGAALKDVDAVARDFIASKGYGEFFGHGLGHGVGLDVHEFPVLNPRSPDLAEPGMVVTIEPGIYLPGKGGVRIEDMYVVTQQGCRVLTRIPKDFRVIH